MNRELLIEFDEGEGWRKGWRNFSPCEKPFVKAAKYSRL